MNKRVAAIAAVVVAVAASVGLFASPSNSASSGCPKPHFPTGGLDCGVSLTAAGPSPGALSMRAGQLVQFYNTDAVPHTVAFAHSHCTLTLNPGRQDAYPGASLKGGTHCGYVPQYNNYAFYVGSYAYTVDGKFPGTVVTTPQRRSVTLTARTHTIQGGTRLSLHGLVALDARGRSPAAPVVVLARHNSTQPFRPVATVRTRGSHQAIYGWKLIVQPTVTTTYIAEVTAQRLCYFPASQCAHPQGQFWVNPKSHPFTVRIHQP